MRQALLVIVLVGAAFGGGALVSGPGFRWAQEHLLDYMGLKDGGEIDTLELTPPPGAAKPAVSEPLAGPAAAKSPPATASAPPPAPQPKATEPYAEAQATATAPSPPAGASKAPAAEPARSEAPGMLGALNAMLTPPKAAEPAPADPALEPSSLPALEAAPAPAPAGTPPAAAATPGGEWAEIRRKLDSAGVTRYTIEGEPGGRVVFACLIPLAGKQAVSQRFEAEGEDEFEAAQSALKRINLWRASHAAPANP